MSCLLIKKGSYSCWYFVVIVQADLQPIWRHKKEKGKEVPSIPQLIHRVYSRFSLGFPFHRPYEFSFTSYITMYDELEMFKTWANIQNLCSFWKSEYNCTNKKIVKSASTRKHSIWTTWILFSSIPNKNVPPDIGLIIFPSDWFRLHLIGGRHWLWRRLSKIGSLKVRKPT